MLFIRRQRQELLALSAYLGALLAIRRKYTPIIHPLFKHARCGDKIFIPLLYKQFVLTVSKKTGLGVGYKANSHPLKNYLLMKPIITC